MPTVWLGTDQRTGDVLYSDPEGGDCTVHTRVAFGKPLDLPAPFSFTLDTGPLR
ncbi:hypothetical protein [Kitasatospora purpeofusca]|uniref:hypothetical protein n=1 Tax=Kitasatospora purpeofusca TaxID=67352 RepID=UPI0036B72C3F